MPIPGSANHYHLDSTSVLFAPAQLGDLAGCCMPILFANPDPFNDGWIHALEVAFSDTWADDSGLVLQVVAKAVGIVDIFVQPLLAWHGALWHLLLRLYLVRRHQPFVRGRILSIIIIGKGNDICVKLAIERCVCAQSGAIHAWIYIVGSELNEFNAG